MNEKKILLTEEQFNWFKQLAEHAAQFALQKIDIPMPGSEEEKQWIEVEKCLAEMEVEFVTTAIEVPMDRHPEGGVETLNTGSASSHRYYCPDCHNNPCTCPIGGNRRPA